MRVNKVMEHAKNADVFGISTSQSILVGSEYFRGTFPSINQYLKLMHPMFMR